MIIKGRLQKMKKMLPILIVAILIVSGFGTLAKNVESVNAKNENIKNTIEADISSIKFIERSDNYLEISLKNPWNHWLTRVH
jgi:sulfite exporter TauE/SafE